MLITDGNVTQALAAYVVLGLEPGSFARACLLQDLEMAHRHAHQVLKRQDIVADHLQWVRQNVPKEAWGSLDKYLDWIGHQGLKNCPHKELNQQVVEARLMGNEPWFYMRLPNLR